MLSSVAELLAKAVHSRAVEEENRRLRHILGRSRTPSADIIGHSGVMQNLFGLIAQVADSNTTVLIHGETGTGKELVARAIHRNSPRLKGPLVQVNCAAIPDTLIESELFGHERGAFTGAIHQRRGRFEEAHGGTIFLDEVGELSAAAQAKLLRVLQEKQFQPLGSSRVVRVDVRVIAATNRILEQDLATGRFRADLFYRLNVFPHLPAAAAGTGERHPPSRRPFRPEIHAGDGEAGEKISPAVSDILLAYHWPGNVRELENCIERAVLLTPRRHDRDGPSAPLPAAPVERGKEGTGQAQRRRRGAGTGADHQRPPGNRGEPDPGGETPRDDETDHPVPDPEDGDRSPASSARKNRTPRTPLPQEN